MRIKRWVVGLVAVALAVPLGALAAPVPAVAPDSPLCARRAGPPAPQLSEISATPLSPRVTDHRFDSAALHSSAQVLVMTPTDFDPSGAVRYPVLYLLHGHGGGARDWFVHDVAGIVDDRDHPVIVVMPDGGPGGWYSDWYGIDLDGHNGSDAQVAPGWETFHLRELIPFVDAHWPTIANRNGRAAAGLSMGGFGAMSYAARHPDLFAAAGSFSGAVDTDLLAPAGSLLLPVASNIADRALPDNCVWGDPVTQGVVWRDHDPTELAANLRHTTVFISAGDGQPGPGDAPGASAPTEVGIRQMNEAFDAALNAAGVEHSKHFTGGVHAWPYWQAELVRFVAMLPAVFASPKPAPPSVPFDYTSAAPSFAVWGWQVDTDKSAPAQLTLGAVSASGFEISGPGIVAITTAPIFEPGVRYEVDLAQCGQGCRADEAGRLHLELALGRPPAQQYLFGPAGAATTNHVRVHISRAA